MSVDTSQIESLELGRGGSFTFRWQGYVMTARDPADIALGPLMATIETGYLPDAPNMPLHHRSALYQRWAAHYDIPPIESAQRLAYVVNRHRDDLEYDLRIHAHVDLGEAWRSRRWRTLLATVDRLPSHCLFSEAVSRDPEHSRLLAESMANRPDDEDGEDSGPPLRTWTPELRTLTDLLDAVRRLEWATFAVQVGKKAGEPPKPSPRPVSLLAREVKRSALLARQARHEALTRRLLPHKNPT